MTLTSLSSDRLSILRFPLIIGVIFIHAYSSEADLSSETVGIASTSFKVLLIKNLISQGIARISVPLFFLISGYLFFKGYAASYENYKSKLHSRIKTLLIPYLFWNIFILLALALAQHLPMTKVYFSANRNPIASYGIFEYLNAILGITWFPIAYQFWFIRDLMIMTILAPIISICLRTFPTFILGTLSLLWFFNLWPIYTPSIVACAFFFAGAYIANKRISLFYFDQYGLIILITYILTLFFDVSTKTFTYNPYIHNIGIVLGIVSVLYISRYLVKQYKMKKLLLWASTFSFFVFAAHEPMLTVLRKILIKAYQPTSDIEILGLYFIIPTIVITASILIYLGIKPIAPRFLKVVTGGR